MSAAVFREYGSMRVEPGLRVPLASSMFLHAIIMGFAYYGMPYVRHNPADLESITVGIVSESELSGEDSSSSPSSAKPLPQKNEMPEPPGMPSPPKMTAEAPPKLEAPKPPELVEEISPPPSAITPSVPVPKPEEVEKKPEPPAMPTEEKKPEENKNEEKAENAEQQSASFNTLLKNLTPHAPEEAQPRAPLTGAGSGTSPLAGFGQQVSGGEMDVLRQQLESCWNIPAGAKYAENLVVEVRLFVNPDRTVRKAEVINPNNNDPFFRTAAESVIRAVYNPRCSPLNLPPDKYDLWNTVVVRFDPREMLQ